MARKKLRIYKKIGSKWAVYIQDGTQPITKMVNGNFDEQVARAEYIITQCNEYDKLKAKADVHNELVENLLNLTRLLCHPGSHVTAKDIDKAKAVIAKTGKNILWGI